MANPEFEKVSAWGEKHGRINIVANSVSEADGWKNMTPENKVKAEKQKKKDHEIIKAQYINSRGPHERLTKPYMLYAGDPIETWHFIPGETYDVWRGLVEEVNRNPGMPNRSEVLDANGVPTKKDGQHEKIHRFVPVAF